ncbi:MAG TPA: hypothetical protein VIG87_05540 [Candidatus Udaeobacter sp.]
MAIWSFAWRVYGACLNVEIQPNEGWNAYFVDAATGKMPLYPSADKLITNNYPPLSFYIVALVGWFIGDPVLAGRLLSLIARIFPGNVTWGRCSCPCGLWNPDDRGG